MTFELMKNFPRLSVLLVAAFALLPGTALAQGGPRTSVAAAEVNWSHPEQLRVGQWTRYMFREMTGGRSQEAEQTILMAGRDTLSADTCVWIETWFEEKGGIPSYTKSLVSLAISRARGTSVLRSLPEYLRRLLTRSEMDTSIGEIAIPKMVPLSSGAQTVPGANTDLQEKTDTLATTDVVTVAGKFRCTPIRLTRDFRAVTPLKGGGGRRLHEQHEEMVRYVCEAVPLTHLVRMTHQIRTREGVIPAGQPDSFDPPGLPTVTLREVILLKHGLDGKSKFPTDAKTVPFGRPVGIP
ncbi:MAG: hypothetical protein HZB25_10255 [Candidatus Eisenbacteria bacterium]|nr:hypothetical protein [Candidatus Eisenbacteria bacterium]